MSEILSQQKIEKKEDQFEYFDRLINDSEIWEGKPWNIPADQVENWNNIMKERKQKRDDFKKMLFELDDFPLDKRIKALMIYYKTLSDKLDASKTIPEKEHEFFINKIDEAIEKLYIPEIDNLINGEDRKELPAELFSLYRIRRDLQKKLESNVNKKNEKLAFSTPVARSGRSVGRSAGENLELYDQAMKEDGLVRIESLTDRAKSAGGTYYPFYLKENGGFEALQAMAALKYEIVGCTDEGKGIITLYTKKGMAGKIIGSKGRILNEVKNVLGSSVKRINVKEAETEAEECFYYKQAEMYDYDTFGYITMPFYKDSKGEKIALQIPQLKKIGEMDSEHFKEQGQGNTITIYALSNLLKLPYDKIDENNRLTDRWYTLQMMAELPGFKENLIKFMHGEKYPLQSKG